MKNDKEISKYLPEYSKEEKQIMEGTMDFIALNYYSAMEVRYNPNASLLQFEETGKELGPKSATPCKTTFL